eukprot:m.26722 g.26722  ORF g.26722 m.26722 type:complete len:354 (+) comp8313_c0_seq1:295-1356(+)
MSLAMALRSGLSTASALVSRQARPLTVRCMSNATEDNPVVPRRALMYLPGHDKRKITKAAGLDLDCVCLDMEDAVADGRKDDARDTIVKALEEVSFGRADVAVRVNPVGSEYIEDDLEALFTAPKWPDTLVVPKVDDADQMDWLFTFVEKYRSKESAVVNLLTQVESSKSLFNLTSICEMDADQDTESLVLAHRGLIFGGDDYAASIGAIRSPDNSELMFARQSVVAHAKAFGLECIDIVNIHFKNLEQLKLEAEEGYRWGFTGKQVIHPNQVPVVQAAFSPTDSQIRYALAIVSAHLDHETQGTGAFSYNGQMIDMPTVRQCQQILGLARLAGVLEHYEVPPSSPPPASDLV